MKTRGLYNVIMFVAFTYVMVFPTVITSTSPDYVIDTFFSAGFSIIGLLNFIFFFSFTFLGFFHIGIYILKEIKGYVDEVMEMERREGLEQLVESARAAINPVSFSIDNPHAMLKFREEYEKRYKEKINGRYDYAEDLLYYCAEGLRFSCSPILETIQLHDSETQKKARSIEEVRKRAQLKRLLVVFAFFFPYFFFLFLLVCVSVVLLSIVISWEINYIVLHNLMSIILFLIVIRFFDKKTFRDYKDSLLIYLRVFFHIYRTVPIEIIGKLVEYLCITYKGSPRFPIYATRIRKAKSLRLFEEAVLRFPSSCDFDFKSKTVLEIRKEYEKISNKKLKMNDFSFENYLDMFCRSKYFMGRPIFHSIEDYETRVTRVRSEKGSLIGKLVETNTYHFFIKTFSIVVLSTIVLMSHGSKGLTRQFSSDGEISGMTEDIVKVTLNVGEKIKENNASLGFTENHTQK